MGNSLGTPDTAKKVATAENPLFRAAVAAMTGHRETMEDAHCMCCTETYGLFGVFDGHAGSQCSAFCAKRLPEEIGSRTLPLSDEDLVDIVLRLDAEFQAKCPVSGTTACFFLVTPLATTGEFLLQVANVGDSRLLVGRSGGAECVALTEDHKPGLKREKDRIERVGGFVEMDRVDGILAVSRALGDADYKRGTGGPLNQKVIAKPDITRITCTSADWVLVACDGVFEGRFNNEEVVRFVRPLLHPPADDLVQAACAVCDEALKRGSTDNITCMLVQFRTGEAGSPLGPPASSSTAMTPSSPMPGPRGKSKRAYEKAGSKVDAIRDRVTQRISTIRRSPSGDNADLTVVSRPPTDPQRPT